MQKRLFGIPCVLLLIACLSACAARPAASVASASDETAAPVALPASASPAPLQLSPLSANAPADATPAQEAPQGADAPANSSPVPSPTHSLTTGRLLTTGTRHSPVLTVIANEPQVRPQMGLMQADILYEFALDRGKQTTRLIAVYSDEYPPLAGPIVDARIYFFDLQREYNATMAYAGYPSEAGYPAFDQSVIDIPAAYGPELRYLFKRDTTVSSAEENTLFCRVDALSSALYGTIGPAIAERFTFGTHVTNESGKRFTRVGLPFCGKDTTGIEFQYHADDNLLYRYERNSKGTLVESRTLSAAKDGASLESEPVRVQNLIVQHVKYTPISDTYYTVELVGRGECDFFINGVCMPGTWRRDAVDGTTAYFLRDGSPLVLEAGTTWIAFNSMQRKLRIQYA